jgi:hypothetical protein
MDERCRFCRSVLSRRRLLDRFSRRFGLKVVSDHAAFQLNASGAMAIRACPTQNPWTLLRACGRLSSSQAALRINFFKEVWKERMLPRENRAIVPPFLRIAVCLLILWPGQRALSSQSDLGATREKLDGLESCLGVGNAAVNKLRQGLLNGWGRGHWKEQPPTLLSQAVAPPPSEYLSSLDRDLQACEVAKKQKDQALRKAILDQVLQDVTIKADDCERFGMGRLIQVNVSTVRGTAAENGWIVFWKWMPVGPLQTVETSIPGLTSPATKAFPPGAYAFRAEKRISSTDLKTTETRTIIVGGTQAIDCPLSIE